jgi:hypothetical protein
MGGENIESRKIQEHDFLLRWTFTRLNEDETYGTAVNLEVKWN